MRKDLRFRLRSFEFRRCGKVDKKYRRSSKICPGASNIAIIITRRTKKPATATNHYGTLQLKQEPPARASQSALLLFDHAFQGDFPRPARQSSLPISAAWSL